MEIGMGETKKMQKRSKWQQTKLEMKKYRMSYVMIAPYFILFFLFTVLPVLASIGISFTDFNMLETPNFVGWRNYIKLLLDDDVFKKAFKNTIIFAVITGPLSYIMCFLFAWIINEFKGKLRAFLTLIFYAPSISGNAFMVWAIIISGDRYGYLNGWLMKWSFLYEPIQWMKTEKYVLPILIIVQLWLSLGTGFLTFIAGLQTVEESLRGWCDGWHQKPLAGIVVHHDSVHASTAHVWSRHADHTVVCGGRYLHQPCGKSECELLRCDHRHTSDRLRQRYPL